MRVLRHILIKILMFLLLVLLCSFVADANEDFEFLDQMKVRDEGYKGEILNNEIDEFIRIKISLTDLDISIKTVENQQFTVVEIPGMPSTMSEGYPILPRITQVLQISDKLCPMISIEAISTRRIPLHYPLLPAQDDQEIEDIHTIISAVDLFQIKSDIYPAKQILMSEPKIMRDVRMVIVSYHPVRFLPLENCLEVVDEAEITIRYSEEDSINKILEHGPYSRSFESLYRALIPNYSDAWAQDRDRNAAEVYLMIMKGSFESRCQGFITWKEQQGFDVEILRLEELTSSTAENIKAAVQAMYNSEKRPVYVCLVGNTNNFPVYESLDYYHPPADPYDDDWYYQLLDGSDLFPETFQSRLPARNSSELTIMLSKILWYEQTPQVTNQEFYKTAIMAAADYYESQITVKEQTAERLTTNLHYDQIHTMYNWSWGSGEQVLDWVEEGVSIINYRGEGWYSGWSPAGGSLDYSEVATLSNTNLLPIITSIGCGVGMFDGYTASFAHTWMTMGSPTNHLGAVAFMGPTFNTRTIINNWIDRGIYRGYCYHDIVRSAPVFVYGKLYAHHYLYDYDPSGQSQEDFRENLETHLREYVLHGTPDMWWRTDMPGYAQVHTAWTPGSDRDGIVIIDEFGNRVPDCQVSFIKDSEHRIYVTDGGGGIKVFMRDISSPIPATVTGHNLFPLFTTYIPQEEGEDGDIMITEFKPDIQTTGTAGDKVELYNNDVSSVNLNGWTIGDLDGYDLQFVTIDAILEPGEIAVVELVGFEGTQSVTNTTYGLLIISTAQPGLSSMEDAIVLRNTNGRVRDSICYHNASGIGSTDATYDMSKLTQPGTGLRMGSGGWWTGPDDVAREQYESLAVDWSSYAGNGGPGSIIRNTIPASGAYDRPDYFTVSSTEEFGSFTPTRSDASEVLQQLR
ncbi:lamin tail domain-containing protein [bacterium]|nr:lamin tail domain-containing protein [bacterium]